MRRGAQQHLALGERLGNQAEFVVFEITQTAVDQLAAPLAGGGREIVLLNQHDRQTAPGSVARDAATVDAAADDQQVNRIGCRNGGVR